MRVRLFILLLALLTIGLAALGIPLAESQARARTQEVFVDRLNDTARFASIAQQSMANGEPSTLAAALSRYDEVYGIAAAILNRDGSTLFATRRGLQLAAVGGPASNRIQAALRGQRSNVPDPAWPWTHGQLVVAEPVVSGGDVLGAVVTVSPFGRTRSEVLRTWARLGLVELCALIVCVMTALGLTRWVLRPVRLVDRLAHEIATGRRGARVSMEKGPPELRHLTRSFNDMAARVEAMLEAQTAFVADASHQLRNPLNALMLRLDDLAMRAPPPWDVETTQASDEGRHLADILDGLLRLADAERRCIAPERVDVTATVAQRVGAWQAVAQVRGMTLRLLDDGPCHAWVEPLALAIAIDTVLDNALKFGPAGSAVTVEVSCDGGWTSVAVTDEGDGLPAEEISRAGDRFWRSRRHQNVEGSGLGLAVARTLLAPSGGRLDVAPGRVRGLRVTIGCRVEGI